MCSLYSSEGEMAKMGLTGIKPSSGQGCVSSGSSRGEYASLPVPLSGVPHIPRLVASRHSKVCFHHHVAFSGSSASSFLVRTWPGTVLWGTSHREGATGSGGTTSVLEGVVTSPDCTSVPISCSQSCCENHDPHGRVETMVSAVTPTQRGSAVVSWGCRRKVPPTGWLRITEIHSLRVLEAKSAKPRCL